MLQDPSLPLLTKIARAARWLFWISLAYTLVSTGAFIVSAGLRMNPVSRSSMLGRIIFHTPGVLEEMRLLISLVFLYLFQANLTAGCRQPDPKKIQTGLLYLYGYLITLAVFQLLELIFQYGIFTWFWW